MGKQPGPAGRPGTAEQQWQEQWRTSFLPWGLFFSGSKEMSEARSKGGAWGSSNPAALQLVRLVDQGAKSLGDTSQTPGEVCKASSWRAPAPQAGRRHDYVTYLFLTLWKKSTSKAALKRKQQSLTQKASWSPLSCQSSPWPGGWPCHQQAGFCNVPVKNVTTTWVIKFFPILIFWRLFLHRKAWW